MGGASRGEKRRKQDRAGERLAAAGITPPTPNRAPGIIVAVVLGVVALVGTGFWIWSLVGGEDEEVAPTYAVTLSATPDGAVAVAGNGPVTVDVYSDYLCPECERFEERFGDEMTTALNEGRITARYHGVAILDNRTDPPGYATRAANAAMCSAQAGVFPAYSARLYEQQPGLGSAGLSNAELLALGEEVGAQPGFVDCVNAGTHNDAIGRGTDLAASSPALIIDGRFGTPTVAVNGVRVDYGDASWLADATGS